MESCAGQEGWRREVRGRGADFEAWCLDRGRSKGPQARVGGLGSSWLCPTPQCIQQVSKAPGPQSWASKGSLCKVSSEMHDFASGIYLEALQVHFQLLAFEKIIYILYKVSISV